MQVTQIIDDRTPLERVRRQHLIYHLRFHGHDVDDNLPAKTLRDMCTSHNLPMPTNESIQRIDSTKELKEVQDKLEAEAESLAKRDEIERARLEAVKKKIEERQNELDPDLEGLKRNELVKLAKDKGIDFKVTMKNAELIEAIRNG